MYELKGKGKKTKAKEEVKRFVTYKIILHVHCYNFDSILRQKLIIDKGLAITSISVSF